MPYSIDYIYNIRDRFSSILNRMGQAATRFESGITRMQGKLGVLQGKFQSAGAKLANLQTGLASLGAGAFLKATLDEATEFQKSLNLTQAVTGATNDTMDTMRERALEWGSQTQFSSKQVAAAMGELGKMGRSTDEILSLMPGTMALAAAGELSMADAANFSMAAINQFGLAVGDAGMVADVLATGASNAATSVGGIASALANTGVQAKMSGLSIKDTTATLMALAQSGLEGAEGGTMLMNALKQLQVMPDKVREGFEGMGIDIDNFRDATTGQMTDFFGLISAMKEAGATGAQLGQMFDVRSMKAMAILVETNEEALMGYRDSLADVTGNAEEMKNTLNKDIEHLIEFQSIMQNLKVIMGSFLSEALAPVLNAFNNWLGNMQKNNPTMLKAITYVLMFTTALGAFLIPLGLMISTIGSIIGLVKTIMGLTKLWTAVQAVLNMTFMGFPLVWIIAGIIALIAIIVLCVKHWDKIKAAIGVAWDWIKEKTMIAVEAIKAFIQSLWEKFSSLLDNPFFAAAATIFAPWLTIPAMILKHWEPIKAFFIDLWEKLQPIVEGVGGFFRGVGDFFTGGEAASPYVGRSPEAPSPGRMRGVGAEANASVSVYTEEGMKAVPFEESGNLGYNMRSNTTRRSGGRR